LVIPAAAIDEPAEVADGAQIVPVRRYFKVSEVARFFGVGTQTLRVAIRDGEFPGEWIRRCLLVSARAINEMVEAALERKCEVYAGDWVRNRVAVQARDSVGARLPEAVSSTVMRDHRVTTGAAAS
jgi:hypothetical protein